MFASLPNVIVSWNRWANTSTGTWYTFSGPRASRLGGQHNRFAVLALAHCDDEALLGGVCSEAVAEPLLDECDAFPILFEHLIEESEPTRAGRHGS